MDKIRLPIKVVTPGRQDWAVPTGGASPRKVFRAVTSEFRRLLAEQVREVGAHFSDDFRKFPGLPAVAIVNLRADALAKSHRPSSLLEGSGCSIIGSRQFGELLVSVQRPSLVNLSRNILTSTTKVGIANLSTIDSIVPYTVNDALKEFKIHGKEHEPVKLKLFQHGTAQADRALGQHLRSHLNALGVQPEPVSAYHGSAIYRVTGVDAKRLFALASFIGTRAVTEFPRYRVLRTASRRLGPATHGMFAPPERDREYPVLGIVDSGIDPESAFLDPWIEDRFWAIAPDECDYSHGTFVGALAIHARQLNNLNPSFPSNPCKLLDVVAFPACGELREDELLQAIEDALIAHPSVRVWNLSLSTNVPCSDAGFSDLGIALDELQDAFNVTFVIAAGNYATAPFRGWPADDLGEDDRIGSPGDSVRGLTVGSLAHLGSASARVKSGQPSPFSRRGPGPAFIPKPEVTHLGGNCDSEGNCIQIGVVSLDGSGFLVEDIGTSYAAPLVASTLANVHGSMAEPMSSSLAKALLIHSAVLGSSDQEERERNYFGFGVPTGAEDILSCAGSAATLVFEPELVGTTFFVKSPFPFPDCLRSPDGRASGEVTMTLVYDPPLDSSWGLEYCRANVEVSLGSFDPVGKGKARAQRRLIPPDEADVRKLYEREVVRNGFKWSPVKVYRRRFNKLKVTDWRLTVGAHYRGGYDGTKTVKPALVITIADPSGRGAVYDEVVLAAQKSGWIIADLRLKQQIRAAT